MFANFISWYFLILQMSAVALMLWQPLIGIAKWRPHGHVTNWSGLNFKMYQDLSRYIGPGRRNGETISTFLWGKTLMFIVQHVEVTFLYFPQLEIGTALPLLCRSIPCQGQTTTILIWGQPLQHSLLEDPVFESPLTNSPYGISFNFMWKAKHLSCNQTVGQCRPSEYVFCSQAFSAGTSSLRQYHICAVSRLSSTVRWNNQNKKCGEIFRIKHAVKKSL